MEYLGVVIEIKGGKAYVITDSCEVYCIKKQPGMYEGLEIVFEHSEIIGNRNMTKPSAIAASVAAVLIAVFCFFSVFNSNKIYAYIDIDMNANCELGINKESKVVDIKTLDKDLEILIEEMNIKKKPLDIAVVEIVEKLNKSDLINSQAGNKVLITACLKDEVVKGNDKNYEKGLQLSYNKIKEELWNRNIEPYFMSIRTEDRKLAVANNISMGRFSVFKLSKEQGIDVDIETLKKSQVEDIVKKINLDNRVDNWVQNTDNPSIGNENNATANPYGEKDTVKDDINNNDTISSNNDIGIGSDNSNKNNDVTNDKNDSGSERISTELAIDESSHIDNIEAIESANIKTQKIIKEIQLEVKNNIILETDKANLEISKVRMNQNLSENEKNERIKKIEEELNNRIREIKQAGNKKAQKELDKLNQKAKDLLP